jgi:uncharacterized metal-binding protein
LVYAIPLFRDRVAPRCTIADTILLIRVAPNHIISQNRIAMDTQSWIDFLKVLNDNKVDTLICGGINTEHRILAFDYGMSIVDNVAGSDMEIIEAIKQKTLRPGFGFVVNLQRSNNFKQEKDGEVESRYAKNCDCIVCPDKQCLEGKTCNLASQLDFYEENNLMKQILDIAMDISLENERTLCRISELVYFALELDYKKIGVAYCIDLSEPAAILTQVMRRFFDVFPVCCKIGGQKLTDPMETRYNKIVCNPKGQAEILNKIGVDFNIIIGLCIGADCIFSQLSNAPVTTLFVKDRSLANNPIGAVYSDYYLKEVTNPSIG